MPVLTINPSASAHDAREVGTGDMTLTGNIALTAAAHWAGLYLPNVTVPPGATINAATRLFYMSGDAGRQDPALNWYAHDTDNAGVFTTTNSNISTRTLTTAVVSDVASNIGTSAYRAVSIASLIAEVVARPGWASGNGIALIGDAQSGCLLEIAAFDIGSNVWYVEIDYTAGGLVTRTMHYARMME